jgi:hypothetical protein
MVEKAGRKNPLVRRVLRAKLPMGIDEVFLIPLTNPHPEVYLDVGLDDDGKLYLDCSQPPLSKYVGEDFHGIDTDYGLALIASIITEHICRESAWEELEENGVARKTWPPVDEIFFVRGAYESAYNHMRVLWAEKIHKLVLASRGKDRDVYIPARKKRQKRSKHKRKKRRKKSKHKRSGRTSAQCRA